MAKITFNWEVKPEGFTLKLLSHSLFVKSHPLPTEEWIQRVTPAQVAGIGQILAWVDEEIASKNGVEVLIPHARIAAFDLAMALDLSLPPIWPYLLDLQHDGTVEQAKFRFKISWLQPNGQSVLGVKRNGASINKGNIKYRLSEPLFGILEAAETFNATLAEKMDMRLQIWAKMQLLLPEESSRSIQLDGYLTSTRVAHASSFSLNFESGADGFTLEPVLFGSEVSKAYAENQEEAPKEIQSLLPPIQQKKFSQNRFCASPECQARYALGSGWYVVLDEPVQKALSVVRQVQMSTPEIRRQFIRNPRSFLAEALGGDLSETVLEAIFIETSEYSDRVRDVGFWHPKVLPWVKRGGENWFVEESFGLQVDGQKIELTAEQSRELRQSIQEAIETGTPSVPWQETLIPATPETLAALDALPIQEKKPITPDDKPEKPPEIKGSPYVLEILGNLAEEEYQRGRIQRPLIPDIGLPICLKSSFKPHQKEGFAWLQEAWITGQSGVLLADDMGLGKTLQALAFLAWLREGMNAGRPAKAPILIVAPTGLLKNWELEHHQHLHAPGLGEPLRVFGTGLIDLRDRKGREIDLGQATLNADQLAHADWILTTYETISNYQHSFAAIRFAAVVFDEMQKIKNPGTLMTHAAKALNANFVLGMTGTPIENRLADLWCLIDTIQPGYLKDLAVFSRTYEKDPKEEDLRRLKTQLTEKSPLGPPLMLRRMKIDRLPGLPKKIDHPLEQIMPQLQAQAYETTVQMVRAEGGGRHVLEALHQLRMISLHPLHPAQATNDEFSEASARFMLTLSILDKIFANGEKVLIFLESIEMQPYLAAILQRRYGLNSLPMLINGTVTGAKRQERINAFQEGGQGFDVIILSPRAGGVGVTLTAANHVIHLSRWWNPAVEDQCTDRVYRIGQKREVHVYYPQAIHPVYSDQSFDRRLHALLERKRHMSREMLIPPIHSEDAHTLFTQTVGSESEQTLQYPQSPAPFSK
ncbi:MAG: DEAD/DEAH box helicase [Magnetococcus sp. DMHC-6]